MVLFMTIPFQRHSYRKLGQLFISDSMFVFGLAFSALVTLPTRREKNQVRRRLLFLSSVEAQWPR